MHFSISIETSIGAFIPTDPHPKRRIMRGEFVTARIK